MTIPAASQYDARFRRLLVDFDEGFLENASGAIYGLWPNLTLAYFNPAWFQFAAENRGEPAISKEWALGRCILEAIPHQLRPFFEGNYLRALDEGRPWVHTYECSSDKVYRQFHLIAFPLIKSAGLLLVNSLRIESAQHQESFPPIEERYTNKHGLMTQCCHCRRFKRASEQSTWDWVPSWVKKMPANISHGICKVCSGFYYAKHKVDLDPPETFSTTSD